jgi:hypothetical protein
MKMTTHTIANMRSAGTDCRVFFRRPDESIYAVIGPNHMRTLKRTRQLDNFLQQQRDSGVVIKIAKA